MVTFSPKGLVHRVRVKHSQKWTIRVKYSEFPIFTSPLTAFSWTPSIYECFHVSMSFFCFFLFFFFIVEMVRRRRYVVGSSSYTEDVAKYWVTEFGTFFFVFQGIVVSQKWNLSIKISTKYNDIEFYYQFLEPLIHFHISLV